jgi:ComF family protein
LLEWAREGVTLFGRAMAEMLFPSPCAVCDADEGPLCEDCRQDICDASPMQCPRCALIVGPWASIADGCSWCRDRRLGFDAAVAMGPYQGPIRDVCLRLKREANAWRARWAADLLFEAKGEVIRSFGADLVVAVPLHWRRRIGRGYNQADALAIRLARRLGIAAGQPLRRVAATPKLADRGRGERAALLRKAFAVRRGARVSGRTILLVDDILTTGATCGAAAKALKSAGAARVVAVVLGRAEGRT